ncbi:MAG: hypothetical protein M5R36_19315 [Deltaproteobacteria bacterium]|nr:hypothetical protein [Deltaproteobacteria bacterium]
MPRGVCVLAAVSGGRDSIALLDALLALAPRNGWAIAAAHVNHHLRPDADLDEALVRSFCDNRGVTLRVRHLDGALLKEGRAAFRRRRATHGSTRCAA